MMNANLLFLWQKEENLTKGGVFLELLELSGAQGQKGNFYYVACTV